MLLVNKRRIGFILACVVTVTMPMEVFASGLDSAQEQEFVNAGGTGDTEVEQSEEMIIDKESDDYKKTDNSASESNLEEDSKLPKTQNKEVTALEGESDIKISMDQCTVTLSDTSFICDGTDKKPTVTVMYGEELLKEDIDYSVKYENTIWPGKAKVTVEGLDNYTGSKTTEYEIRLGSTILESTSSYSAVTVTWKSVPGATGYQISRSTSQNGIYTDVVNVSADVPLVVNDKNTKFNGTYYYKIRANCNVNGTIIYGEWSPIKAQKKMLAAPVIKSAKKSKKSIKLTWGKVKGADGYVVYRSKSVNGKYTKIATIKKASEVTYVDKNAAKKGYCYKVKAYRTVKKKKYYGYLSESKATSKTTSTGTSVNGAGGWRYVKGYKLYYDKNGNLVKDVSSIIGKQSSYVIKVNKKKNCVTVYAKDGKNGYIIPVKAFPCSSGNATPITTARTPAKYRWHRLNGNCYGQWCTRIKQGFLFHSVMYGRTSNSSLSVSNYNKLGTTASHGCIRLRAGDAKWIYDNCKLKTKVIIYNSSNPGPLGKPSAVKLPKWHRWDPTDPTAREKCKQRGCH